MIPHVHLQIDPIVLWRRIVLAVLGAAAGVLYAHGYLAATLVSRGDDFMKAGRAPEALHYYERAHWFDPAWEVATDRIGFTSSTMTSPAILRRGVAVTGEYLAQHPRSTQVRWDLGICQLHLGDRRAALATFRILARDATAAADPQASRYREIALNLARASRR